MPQARVRRIARGGLETAVPSPEPVAPTPLASGPTRLDLGRVGIRTVLWATGFRRDYPWLRIPVLDATGEIRHRGGFTPVPGLYVLGLNFLRRRTSSFLTGVGADAVEIADHLVRTRAPVARGRAIA